MPSEDQHLLDLADRDAKLLAKASALPVRDSIVLLRSRGLPTRLRVDDVAPGASEADRESAERLLKDAFKYGDRFLRLSGHPATERAAELDVIRAEMREEHPGFVDSTYGIAFDYGCYLAK